MNTPISVTEDQSLPAKIFQTFAEILGGVLDSTQRLVAEHAMDFLLGVLTLLIGWILASVLRGTASKLARAMGVDIIADRSGLRRFMRKNEIHQAPSRYLGWIIFALILYASTLAACERMGLHTVADFLRQVASIIPRAGVVILMLALGVGLGKIAQKLTSKAARIGGLPVPDLLGGFCRIAVVIFASFLALNYLEWASQSVLLGGFALVIGLAVGLALLLTFAARNLTESLLNHPFIKSTYNKGDFIRCEACEGKVVKIEAAATHIRHDEALTIVPNRVLAAQTVHVIRGDANAAGKI
ncbi:MAG: mechanosensitive ion channel [Verrucomicrobia bacterium]|nr:mechanosensitive ion channel [Verrucomicrobiota bacterium]MCH8512169.1 mechanosensitive ion channel [Kiritimatiellia bacterium]